MTWGEEGGLPHLWISSEMINVSLVSMRLGRVSAAWREKAWRERCFVFSY